MKTRASLSRLRIRGLVVLPSGYREKKLMIKYVCVPGPHQMHGMGGLPGGMRG